MNRRLTFDDANLDPKEDSQKLVTPKPKKKSTKRKCDPNPAEQPEQPEKVARSEGGQEPPGKGAGMEPAEETGKHAEKGKGGKETGKQGKKQGKGKGGNKPENGKGGKKPGKGNGGTRPEKGKDQGKEPEEEAAGNGRPKKGSKDPEASKPQATPAPTEPTVSTKAKGPGSKVGIKKEEATQYYKDISPAHATL